MELETLREYCLSLALTEECTPFGPTILVYKIGGKIFAFTDIVEHNWVNLKCDPDKAIELRDQYAEVVPGYHMNKRHWNTVRIDADLPDAMIRLWIKESYDLVFGSLPKALREELCAQ